LIFIYLPTCPDSLSDFDSLASMVALSPHGPGPHARYCANAALVRPISPCAGPLMTRLLNVQATTSKQWLAA